MLFQNKNEFKQTFQEYYNPLCNFAASYLKSTSLQAEDLVQDVFIHLWNNRSQLTVNTDMKTYLFQATKNKVFEKLRQEKSYNQLLEKWNNSDSLSAEDDQNAQRLLKLEQINISLRHLPPKCRQVFTMQKFKGLTYTEIADELGISIKTVENHMLKAVKILREKLAK